VSIIEIGNALIVDYSDITTSNNSIINNIVNNTVNTWQQDRGYLEKQRDTQLGKLAEDAVICVFNNLKISNYHSYDDFRSDEFKDHAPFDGIFIENLDNEIIEFINNAVKNEGSRLSSDTREQLRKYNAYTVEVKSTRLAQKYKDRANFHDYNNANEVKNLVDSLMNLDYLTYPFQLLLGIHN